MIIDYFIQVFLFLDITTEEKNIQNRPIFPSKLVDQS